MCCVTQGWKPFVLVTPNRILVTMQRFECALQSTALNGFHFRFSVSLVFVWDIATEGKEKPSNYWLVAGISSPFVTVPLSTQRGPSAVPRRHPAPEHVSSFTPLHWSMHQASPLHTDARKKLCRFAPPCWGQHLMRGSSIWVSSMGSEIFPTPLGWHFLAEIVG